MSWDAFIDRCTTLLYAVKRSCDLIITSAECGRVSTMPPKHKRQNRGGLARY